MAVIWKKQGTVTRTTHVGLVMSSSWCREIKVMSDVYATESCCFVWNPTTFRQEILVLGNDFDDRSEFGSPTVDIDEATKVKWEAIQEIARKAAVAAEQTRREAEGEAEARRELLTIKRGSEVVVTNGSKISHGTRGTVFWVGNGNFGTRVGFKDSADQEYWTAQSNVTAVLPGKAVDFVPPGGWRAFRDAQVKEEEAIVPRKNDKVRRIKDGLEGIVFWVKGTRIGFKVPPATEAVWADAKDVMILGKDGKPKNPPPVATPTPPPPPSAAWVNPLGHLPAPYCHIRGIVPPLGDNDSWSAVDEYGDFLMNLTESSAAKIKALVDQSD